jgi:hypothetical protein
MSNLSVNYPICIYYLELSIGGISCLASSFIFLIFGLCREFRGFSFELIFYFIFANFMNTVSYLINFIEDPNIINFDNPGALCKIQAFIMIWFEVALILWSTIISIYICTNSNLILEEDTEVKKKRILFLIFGFIIPFAFSLTATLSEFTGPAGMWCWMKSGYDTTIITYYGVAQYIAIWISIITNMALCAKALFNAKNIKKKEERIVSFQFIKGLCAFPIISFISWLPATANRTLQYFNHSPIFTLEIMDIIFNQIQGLIYVLATIVIHGWKEMWTELKEEIRQRCCNLDNSRLSHSFSEKSVNSKQTAAESSCLVDRTL